MGPRVKLGLLCAGMVAMMSSASANIVNIQLGAAATNIGPNFTNFDSLASAGASLSLNLVPGVPQTNTFYSVGLNPACNVAVCNGTFTRGLNFGFVAAQDTTVPGTGSVPYVQSVKDTIASANTAASSHVLGIAAGGFDMQLNNGEHLAVSVPAQNFLATASGDIEQVDGVSASFVLNPAAVPEPSVVCMICVALGLVAAMRYRLVERRRIFVRASESQMSTTGFAMHGTRAIATPSKVRYARPA